MATEMSTMAVIRAARPSFRSSHDKAAFAIHAAFLSSGYVLNSTGAAAFVDDALSSSSADEVRIDNWNEVEDNYAFLYFKPENGSKKVLVKCLAMKDKLLVSALQPGDSKPLHLEVNNTYMHGSVVLRSTSKDYESQFKNLGSLVADVNTEILVKLAGSAAASSSSDQPLSSETNSRDETLTGVAAPAAAPGQHYFYPPLYFCPPPLGFVFPPAPAAPVFADSNANGSSQIYPYVPYNPWSFRSDPLLPGAPLGVSPPFRFDAGPGIQPLPPFGFGGAVYDPLFRAASLK